MKENEFPLNDEIKTGMNVLAELIKDRGSGKLTEGVVKKKISFLNYDEHGVLVILENNEGKKLQGRVHKILDFVERKNSDTVITIEPNDFYNNRKKVINLLSEANDFIYLIVGYWKHKHFDILNEVLDNNDRVKEIKIATGLPFLKNGSVDKNEFGKIETYSDLFKKSLKKQQEISIDLKFLTEKKMGYERHARFYFTKNQAWNFIDLDIMQRSQRENIFRVDDQDNSFESILKNDFYKYWNHEKTFSLFGNGKALLLKRFEELENKRLEQLEKEK